MSKKKRQEEIKSASIPVAPIKDSPQWYQNKLYAQIAIVILAIAYYINTLSNQYALDDLIVITMNSFTKKGFAGIGDLITKDSMYGFIGNASELSGGRWRPLSLITYAIEYQFFGQSPHISHVINILLYSLTCSLLFTLLNKYLFKNNFYAAFIATLIFTIHPIHTEVVANIKSRDEILSLLFLLGMMKFSLDYYYSDKKFYKLLLSFLFYFCALLSKENGATYFAILPLTFFIVSKDSLLKCIKQSIPFFIVFIFYALFRFSVIGLIHKSGGIEEVMNAPYLYATTQQAIATKILVLFHYIKLLFIPYPLSYDYSYNQIPYVNFSDSKTILSILIQGSLIVIAFIKIKSRSILSYGILFYFLSIFIVSNFIVDIGAPMGERFLFQASVGFAIAITALGIQLLSLFKLSTRQLIIPVSLLLLVLIASSAFIVIPRNKDWKDDITLNINDLKVVPNSARAQNGAGASYVILSDSIKDETKKKAILDSAIYHLNQALKIHPKYVDPLLNLGTAYNRLKDIPNTERVWNEAEVKSPNHPKLKEYYKVLSTMYLNEGLKFGVEKNYQASINSFNKSVKYNPNNADAWYNLGGALISINNFDEAEKAWQKCIAIKPDYPQAREGLNFIASRKIQFNK
jgi:tetratricopeptide (TPR) repeat protein